MNLFPFTLTVFTITGRGSMLVKCTEESTEVIWQACFKPVGNVSCKSFPATVGGFVKSLQYALREYIKFFEMSCLIMEVENKPDVE